MTAPVRIEARAWGDVRFMTLARLLGLADSDYALIKVARLWSWQTEHFSADRPTYVVDADTIESVLGPGGPAALVRARLASPVDGGYRLHGTEGQIEWCRDLSSTRQLAGRARAANAKRDSLGRLLPRESSETEHNHPANGPAPVQHPSSDSPAQSSAPSPSPSPSPEEDLYLARYPERNGMGPHGEHADLAAAPLALTESPAKKPRRAPRSSAAPETEIPSDWAPRPEELAKARELGLNGVHEAAQFRDTNIAKGRKYVNWDAAFRTWIRRAPQYAKSGGYGASAINGHRRLASNSTDDEPDLSSYPKVT